MVPPRRFAPLASFEPDDNEYVDHTPEPLPQAPQTIQHEEDVHAGYEEPVEPVAVSAPQAHAVERPAQSLDDDDLDVPAFIRRKVE